MTILRRGMRGDEVRMLQRELVVAGFNPGEVDGRFGGGTEAAVMAFQRSKRLLADGVAGPKTLAALVPSASSAEGAAPVPDVTGSVTVDAVSRMFPHTPVRRIRENLPHVLGALRAAGLTDRRMVLCALATIRAESEGFEPVSEFVSRFNTSPGGHEFDLYDHRDDLGNRGRPDGARYCGRGFIQLTGRDNYLRCGALIGLDKTLADQPERANDPETAAKLLVAFLADKEVAIKSCLIEGDLRGARRLVNGGSHGLDRFVDAYVIGERVIPESGDADGEEPAA